MPGMRKTLRQLAVIGQQQQPFRKIVKSADRIKPQSLVFRSQAAEHGGPAFRIAHGADHMNVLTGETGAGKSFILKALGFLLGDKLSADMVRAGAERAQVEALFSTSEADMLTGIPLRMAVS